MLNNDVLRRVRYILQFGDNKMMSVFSHVGVAVNREELSNLLKKDDDPDYRPCNDTLMSNFLNGLIIEKRGRKDGVTPEPEKALTNNIILRKLTIAFNLKSEEVIEVLKIADLRVSKHELSAFFRKADHKNYRECKDQILRNFLAGLSSRVNNDD